MAQLKDTTIDGALTVTGAASFGDKASTRQGLNYIGSNPHGGINNDTPAVWKTLGTGCCWIGSGQLLNQPTSNGFLETRTTNDGYISQTFTSMTGSSEVFHREGDLTYGWYASSKEWVRVVDKNFIYKQIWNGSCTKGGTMTNIAELMNYRLYAIYMSGHGTVILGIRWGEDYIRGIGGYSNATPTNFTYHFGGEIGTNKTSIKYIGCNYMYHSGEGSHGPNNKDLTITEICGII